MHAKPLAFMPNKTPLFISSLLHLALLVGLYAPLPQRDSLIQIDIQLQNSAGLAEVSSPTQKTLNQAAQSQASKLNHSRKVDSDITQNGDSTTVLGRDIGIHVTYPRLSRLLKESGEVLIAVDTHDIRVSQSSRYARLDESALSATKAAFQAGRLAKNANQQIRFIFNLSESEAN